MNVAMGLFTDPEKRKSFEEDPSKLLTLMTMIENDAEGLDFIQKILDQYLDRTQPIGEQLSEVTKVLVGNESDLVMKLNRHLLFCFVDLFRQTDSKRSRRKPDFVHPIQHQTDLRLLLHTQREYQPPNVVRLARRLRCCFPRR